MNKKQINYVFDVDGTLTPSRLPIDPAFSSFFEKWMEDKNVYLLTGSDHEKTIEQVGEYIWLNVTESHQSAGNEIYRKGKLTYSNDWQPSELLIQRCESLIDSSAYISRYGNHLEIRTGLLNISVVGRDCTQSQREHYYTWDKINKDRERICEILNTEFPELDCTAGGQISIDIHQKGKDKSQIRNLLQGPIYFYGDKTEPGGNDYAIASVLKSPDKVYQVENWQETYELLKQIT